MKRHHIHFLFFLLICLTASTFNPTVASPSPFGENGGHFCGVTDSQPDRDRYAEPIKRSYARTAAANLNVGEPRTMWTICFLPNDRPYRAEVVQRMKDEIRNIQTFFAEQMGAHGYGNKTFRVETDPQGVPIVHRVDGQHPDSYYIDNPGPMFDEIERAFNLNANIYLIVIDNSVQRVTENATGIAGIRGKNGGFALVNEDFSRNSAANLATHELGHAFGLGHDFRDGAYIMSYGSGASIGPVWSQLSACSAGFLAVHPYFNPNTPIEEGQPPTIELISSPKYPAGSKSVPVQLKVSDLEGLHQVLLLGPGGLIACRGLNGEKDALVEFDYDGNFTPDGFTSLSDRAIHPIHARVIDTDRNTSNVSFNLFSETLQSLTKISGDNQPPSFPNVPLPLPFVVEVRDVNNGSARQGVWVTFTVTVGGGTLSTERVMTDFNGRAESTLTLGPNLGTNTVEVSAVGSTVTFNAVAERTTVNIPDSNLRAFLEKILNKGPGTPITPADMATLTETDTKRGASGRGISDLTGLEFAINLTHLDLFGNSISDISPLASLTNLTLLYLSSNSISDISAVSGLTNLTSLGLGSNSISDIAAVSGLTNLTSLGLDGNSISDISAVSGLTNLTELNLWNNSISDISAVSGLTNLTWLHLGGNSISDISAVSGLTNLTWLHLGDNSISDISSLVANTGLGSGDSVYVWRNPLSYLSIHTHIPTLQERGVKIEFTNQAYPALLKISGDNQQSDPGAVLAQPFVVEVQDENGSVLAGVPVTFAITKGGGTLRAIRTTTNKSGRAESTLTLGPDAGTNTVSVSAAGIQQTVTFNAEGVRTPHTLLKISGDTQKGVSGTALANPFVVEVRDANGDAFEGVRVTFAVTAGGGTLRTQSTTTNSNGRAESTLTLGPNPGTNTVSVSAAGIQQTVTFNAEGVRTPHTLLKISGDTQKGVSGTALANPFVVEVRDANGDAFEGVRVTFAVTAGGGTLRTQSTTTNSNGRAESTLTLGFEAGTNTVLVSVEGISEQVTFNAIGEGIQFDLSVPTGISLIHVPLKVTAVDGVEQTIESIADLYDALGGADTVSLIITYDPKTQRWHSYLGPQDKDKPANKALTDDLGIIASMKVPKSVLLSGDALGTNGRSSITLHPGTNLVEVPLRDSRIARVSDLFALEGIGDNVSVIIVSDDGFKGVAQAGDDGDIPIMGEGSFILTAREAATVPISGTGWYNRLGPTAALPMVLRAIEVGDTTPVLAVSGSIVFPVGGASLPRPLGSGFQVTVKNLSTSKSVATVTEDEGVDYQLTFVNTETGRAAQVGDILEITAQSPDPFVGVQPLRYMVTPTDVKRNHIPLDELVAYEIPAETELLLNYPNPFNPETWIPYRLAEDAFVTLTIYDLSGGLVRRIDVGHRIAAVYESRAKAVHWDGRNQFGERVASGIYFYHLSAGDYSATRKMVISK